ncbi:MAG: DUF4129 domain-containing protein [Candidatus Saccharimonas sp.]|nr:DUF4129 domain-containing protein [Planctomycetaceae bacterium]
MEQAAIPSPETLREKAAEIVAGRDYRLDSGQSDNGWMFALMLEIIEWILVPFRWLFDLTEGLPSVLRWMIVLGLAAIVALLIGHIVYSIVTAVRGPKRVSGSGLEERRRSIDPAELERLAGEAARRADYITAIRFLFRACVVRLERSEKKMNRPGTTNRELLRRYRSRPGLGDSLRQLVETIDRKWYGDEACSDADYAACQSAHSEVCRTLGEPAHALSA